MSDAPEPKDFVARVILPVTHALGRAFQVFFFTSIVLCVSATGLEYIGGDATAGFLWQLVTPAFVLAFMAFCLMLLLAMIFD